MRAEAYEHRDAKTLLRPDVGTQAQFRKKKPPRTYRFDSSLSPALDWDGQNAARELGEWLLGIIERAAARPDLMLQKPESVEWQGQQVQVRGLRDAVEDLRIPGRLGQ